MKAREFLESYGELLERVGRLEREAGLCRRFGKENPDNTRWATRADDLDAQARKTRRLMDSRRREIECALSRLDRPHEAQVLSLRYILQYTYEQIAEVCNYSPRHVQRLHVQAVGRLEPLMDRQPSQKNRCK